MRLKVITDGNIKLYMVLMDNIYLISRCSVSWTFRVEHLKMEMSNPMTSYVVVQSIERENEYVSSQNVLISIRKRNRHVVIGTETKQGSIWLGLCGNVYQKR